MDSQEMREEGWIEKEGEKTKQKLFIPPLHRHLYIIVSSCISQKLN